MGARELLASEFNFDPNVTPQIGSVNYDETDVENEAARLAAQFQDKDKYLSVTCPHCGVDFYLDRKDLK